MVCFSVLWAPSVVFFASCCSSGCFWPVLGLFLGQCLLPKGQCKGQVGFSPPGLPPVTLGCGSSGSSGSGSTVSCALSLSPKPVFLKTPLQVSKYLLCPDLQLSLCALIHSFPTFLGPVISLVAVRFSGISFQAYIV